MRVRQLGFQSGDARLRDTRLPEVDRLEFAESGEFGDPGIRDLGVVKIDVFEFSEALEMIETCIADGGAFEVEFLEVLHSRDGFEAAIRDFAACNVERGDLIGNRRKRFEARIGEFLGDVQRGEAECLRICGDWHQRGTGGVHFLHRGSNSGIGGGFVIGGMCGEGKCQGEEELGWFHETVFRRK